MHGDLKSSPEAPGEGYLVAEAAEQIGLPAGVINVVTADRDVSELLVSDPRVDKITFTGSTAAGRRIASLCGERIARCTLELGGKSAAVVLDDADLATAATVLAGAECSLTGQVCSSLTRIIVTRRRHDELVDALAASVLRRSDVGDPFDAQSQMGPLAMERQRDRVEGYIAKGVAEGATLATGGGRPTDLDRGWYVEPTVFANVDNSLDHRPGGDLRAGARASSPPTTSTTPSRIANDTIYGLNASVFTADADRARAVAGAAAVGHGRPQRVPHRLRHRVRGFKQSGHRARGRQGRAAAVPRDQDRDPRRATGGVRTARLMRSRAAAPAPAGPGRARR